MGRFGRRVLLVTGEVSGERHASRLVKELSLRLPGLEVDAVGGQMLKDEGARIICPYLHVSVTGLYEAFLKIPAVLRMERRIRAYMEEARPALFLPVDFPGLNLRLCKVARGLSIPVVYFIPPQVWAWGEGRVKRIRECVRRVISFLPFERDFFVSHGVDCIYVGHPYLHRLEPFYADRKSFLFSQGIEEGTIITFMPGSRKNEVIRHMPLLGPLLSILRPRIRDLRVVIPVAYGLDISLFERPLREMEDVFLLKGLNIDALKYCDLALLASGSASIEALSLCTPSIVIYRLSPLSFFFAKRMVKVGYISIPNLLAGREIFPEFVQRLDPSLIAEEIFFMLENGGRRAELLAVKEKFRVDIDPYKASAEAIIEVLEEHYGPLS